MTLPAVIRPVLQEHVERVRAAVTNTMSAGLEAGRALAALKAECRHGEWLPALAAAGLPERGAQRLMRYAREVKARGLAAAPPPVTALLTEARTPKSDTVSDLDAVDALPIDGEPLPADARQLFPIIEELMRFGTFYEFVLRLPRGRRARYSACVLYNSITRGLRALNVPDVPPDWRWDGPGHTLWYSGDILPSSTADLYHGGATVADEYPMMARHFPGALAGNIRAYLDEVFDSEVAS